MGTDGHGCAWTYGQSPSTSYVSRQNVTHGYKMLQNELILLQSNHRELKSKYKDLQSKYSDLQSKYLDLQSSYGKFQLVTCKSSMIDYVHFYSSISTIVMIRWVNS